MDKEYNQAYFKKRGKIFTDIKSFSFALFLKSFLNPKSLLDVGCAEGKLVGWARKLGIDAYGVDISEEGFSQAPLFVPQRCQVGDILKLPFQDNQFEVVTSLAVLEHIEKKDTGKALGELIRVSQKYVFLQICVRDNPLEGEHFLLDPTHVNIEGSSWWVKKFQGMKVKTKFAVPRLGLFLLLKK